MKSATPDLGDRRRVGDRETLRVLRRADSRRQRIAGERRHVGDAAALHTLRRTHRALRKHITTRVSIVARVGVDETAYCAVLRGDFRLDAAPRPAVFRDDDRATHRDAATLELLVI